MSWLRILGLFLLLFASSFSSEIRLKDYDRVAIATDLEPDDVLALKLLFKESNRIYKETGHYPIGFILVGEGNSWIKKQRMERMLQEFFAIPEGVKIEVGVGRSTRDNLFPYDGEELFDKSELAPFQDEWGVEATLHLAEYLEYASTPLIIQLKPVHELILLPDAVAEKTTALFYGSFNFRKTLENQEQLQGLLDLISASFLKVGIVESYGVLGEESAVYQKHLWTQPIAEKIEQAKDDFSMMFKKLVANWNRYLVEAELPEVKQRLTEIKDLAVQSWMYFKWLSEWGGNFSFDQMLSECADRAVAVETLMKNIDSLMVKWNDELFSDVYEAGMQLSDEKLQKSLKFINQLKPSPGLQFTLSDVIVALAAADQTGFFKANPVQIVVNEHGYLNPVVDESSKVFYYNRVNREKFAQILVEALTDSQEEQQLHKSQRKRNSH